MLLVPFIVYQLITFLSRFVSDIGLDMQQWLMPQQYFPIEPVKAGAEVLLLALIVLGIYCVRVKKMKHIKSLHRELFSLCGNIKYCSVVPFYC